MQKEGKMLINKEQNRIYAIQQIYNASMNFYFYSE